jgi:hypothetical protein
MSLTVLQNPVINPSAVWYSGKCASCQTVVTGQIAAGGWTFYQSNPSAEYVPSATAQPLLFPSDNTAHILDWLYADCPTSGCPATIWTSTKQWSITQPAPNPVSNSPAPVQPLT